MKLQSIRHAYPLVWTLLIALCNLAPAAANDPRTPINAVNTPGTTFATYHITQPGSYYLEEMLVGEPAKHGILISASGVQIDLMGFHVFGNHEGLDGIQVEFERSLVTVKNGTIVAWQRSGLNMRQTTRATVRKITVQDVGDAGIQVRHYARIENCSVSGAPNAGIFAEYRANVRDCLVEDAGIGIHVAQAGVLRNCAFDHTPLSGIFAGPGSLVVSCSVSRAGGAGIFGSVNITVIDCTVESCTGAGIVLTRGTVRNCSVSDNGGHGIYLVEGDGLLVGNRIVGNGIDGIRVASGARVEQNDVRRHTAGFGIHVTGTRSFVVNNTLFGNATSLSVVNGGNFVGPLVSPNAVYGRDDPWANIHGN